MRGSSRARIWISAFILLLSQCVPLMGFTPMAQADQGQTQDIVTMSFDGDVKDSSGQGHDGIAKQTPRFEPGIKGEALRIVNQTSSSGQEAEQFIRFRGSDSIRFGSDDFSIALWYKTAVGDNNGASIIGNKDYGSGDNDGFVMGSFKDTVRVNLALDGSRRETDRIHHVIDGQWHYLVANYSRSDDLSVYVDGRLSASRDISDFRGRSIDAGDLVLGADSKGAYGLQDSLIDELTVSKGLLSSPVMIHDYIRTVITHDETVNSQRLATAQADGLIDQSQVDVIREAIKAENALIDGKDLDALDRARAQVETAFLQGRDSILQMSFDGDFKDASGKGFDGLATGSPRFVPGVKGKAIAIHNSQGSQSSRAEQSVTVKGDALKLGTGNFSVGFWYKANAGDDNGASIIGNKDYGSGTNPGFVLGSFEHDIRVNLADGTTRRESKRIGDVIDARWHRIVANYDRSGDLSVYVDGMLKSTTDLTPLSGKSADAGKLVIGADANNCYGLNDSSIDDLTIKHTLDGADVIAKSYVEDKVVYEVRTATEKLAGFQSRDHVSAADMDELRSRIARVDGLRNSNDPVQVDSASQELETWLARLTTIDDKTNGLVLYAPLDDLTGKDDSGLNNNGTVVGSPDLVDGVMGKALRLRNSGNQAKQYVDYGLSGDFAFKGDGFGASFWYRSPQKAGDDVVLGNKDWSNGANPGWVIARNDKGLKMNYASSTARFDTAAVNLDDGQWHFVVANFDRAAGSMSLYADGKATPLASARIDESIDESSNRVRLGADANLRYPVTDMAIDELRLYNRVITDKEMNAQYLPGLLGLEIGKAETTMNLPGVNQARKNQLSQSIADARNVDTAKTEVVQRRIRDLRILEEELQAPSDQADFAFDVLSDVHLSDDQSKEKFKTALGDMPLLNPNSRALLFGGDNTDSGSESQVQDFFDILGQERGGKVPMVALGNHDVRWRGSPSNPNKGLQDPTTAPGGTTPVFDRYLQHNAPYMTNSRTGDNPATRKQLYWDQWVEGYHFLVLNTEKDLKDQAALSDAQINWVEKTIAIDATPDKPIFFVVHQTMAGTADHVPEDQIGGSAGGVNEARLRHILAKYPQSVVFTGHVHNGPDLLDAHNTPYGHIVDMPSFRGTDYGSELTDNIGYKVEVTGTHVRIRMRDYINRTWLDEGKLDFDLNTVDPVYTMKKADRGAYIVRANSADAEYDTANKEGAVSYLDDENRNSNWRSMPLSDVSQAWVDFAFDKPTKLAGVSYLPYIGGYFETGRHSGYFGTSEGDVLDYRLETSSDGGRTYQEVAKGTLQPGMKEKLMPIKASTVTNIRVVPLSTYGTKILGRTQGYVAAAEMHPELAPKESIGTLTLEYRDKAGNRLKPDETKTAPVGTPYSIDAPTISGFRSNSHFDGHYTESGQVLTFIYEKMPDLTRLRNLIIRGKALDPSAYDPVSFSMFSQVLDEAIRILGKGSATQAEVDGIESRLQAAIAGLHHTSAPVSPASTGEVDLARNDDPGHTQEESHRLADTGVVIISALFLLLGSGAFGVVLLSLRKSFD